MKTKLVGNLSICSIDSFSLQLRNGPVPCRPVSGSVKEGMSGAEQEQREKGNNRDGDLEEITAFIVFQNFISMSISQQGRKTPWTWSIPHTKGHTRPPPSPTSDSPTTSLLC